jgi:hypothetical protein
MTLKNAYNARPDEIQPGDEFCFVVKLMVGRRTPTGNLIYRIYRCPFEGDEAPQGSRIDTDREVAVMQALFPVVAWAKGKADPL